MSASDDRPLTSCLMVTADRPHLMRRSVRCFRRQTYPRRELVVVDDGETDLSSVLAPLATDEVQYVPLDPDTNHVLGTLRNVALDAASGTYLTQWDDDDWYHAERLERQAAVLDDGADACALRGTLMHLDTPEYFRHPYIGLLEDGVPGSIMHRRDDTAHYPDLPRAEDTAYLKHWLEQDYRLLPTSQSHLFIRCFHGDNTWEQDHFLTRMRNTPRDAIAYVWHRYVRGNLYRHRRFQLSNAAWDAFETYLEDSTDLGLFDHAPSATPAASIARQ
jgi:glycosyltransferase involved in cell wall biosynthesis